MTIRLAKGKKGKPGTLTCVRDDGSCTWQRSSAYFAHHDLIHYAVETTLGYRDAFLGLVAQGRDLDSFGTKDGVKDVYTQEEGWAEHIAGSVQWPMSSAGPPPKESELLEMLARSCANGGLPAPPVTLEQLAQIRAEVRALHQRWEQLPEGGMMELDF